MFKEIKGCELLKRKLEKKREELMKNKRGLELDSREFKSLFSFDIFDVKIKLKKYFFS